MKALKYPYYSVYSVVPASERATPFNRVRNFLHVPRPLAADDFHHHF